ncbi:MAG: hypothetical protein WBH40_05665 [Ignavibacteriaceae bacterium]|jgi:hypothetical protein
MDKKIIFITVIFLIVPAILFSQQVNSVLIYDSFNELDNSWTELSIGDDGDGKIKVNDGHLNITGSTNYFGVNNNKAISGHFIVDAEFEADDNVGLVLLMEKEGKPDINNYIMLCVDKNKNGLVTVNVRDCQNGKLNVLDFTGKTSFEVESDEEEEEINLGPDLYEHVLTGNQYSVPFTETNKRIRIFRDDNAGFFHYYYQVSKEYEGNRYVDWMELRPSPDWAKPGTNYFVALMSLHEGETKFNSVESVQKPASDKDDRATGFKVTQREYNWSGFIGDAYVITFDDTFPFHNKDIKFVFWTEMNYIPAWHLNNQLLYTYEFVETWDEQVAGCHEPMSDRMRQWTWVKVLEDNSVRKVLQWHYVLCNPDYQVPAEGFGTQLPEVDEYWTFYPDGSGTRHIVYTPKLDTDFREAHELGEFISIAGSKSHSSDFYASPALTMMNLQGEFKQAHPGSKFDYYSDIDDWKQQILTVHFVDEPDVFCAWSVDPNIPETYSGYKIRYENAWQNPDIKCVHWPVNKRPYTSAFSSGGTWKAEVSHACLLSWGVRDGIEWEDHFKVDERGRKYREWISLVGLNSPNNNDKQISKTRSWLFPGNVEIIDGESKFIKIDYKQKAFILETSSNSQEVEFKISPIDDSGDLFNPAFRINNWGAENNISLFVNGEEFDTNSFRITTLDDKDLLVWLNDELQYESVIKISK